LFLDSTLAHLSVIVDSAALSASSSLVPLGRDSTLFVDFASFALLVIDDHGRVARTISLPKVADMYFVGNGNTYGTPIVDANGRLVYRASYPKVLGVSPFGPAIASRLAAVPDSAPLVRADFDTRTIDTIGFVAAVPESKTVSARMDTTTRPVHMVLKDIFNPLAPNDDWVGMSDGSIAIVRAHDYHVDFIGADGRMHATPKLPYVWTRLTEADKQHLVDSLRPLLAQAAAYALKTGFALQTSVGLRRSAPEYEALPASALADYVPPFVRGTARADLDGNVWILPRATVAVGAGLLYDVVNRNGQLVERVRLPAGRVLAGFGPHGVALLTSAAGLSTHIEVARIR
jgi:hypothetical protein